MARRRRDRDPPDGAACDGSLRDRRGHPGGDAPPPGTARSSRRCCA